MAIQASILLHEERRIARVDKANCFSHQSSLECVQAGKPSFKGVAGQTSSFARVFPIPFVFFVRYSMLLWHLSLYLHCSLCEAWMGEASTTCLFLLQASWNFAGKPSISLLLVTTPASEDWCAKGSLFILPGCFLQCRRDVVTWLQRGPLSRGVQLFPWPGTLNVHLGTAMKAKAGMKPSAWSLLFWFLFKVHLPLLSY